MKTRHRKQWIAAAVMLAAGAATAADAPVRIPLPLDFGIQPTGTTEAVLYTETTSESFNPVLRPVIEGQCADARELGLTTHTPVFEAGYGQPVKTFSQRINSARASATLTTFHAYQCDAPGPRITDQCACTFRTRIRRTVHIKKLVDGQRALIHADIAAGTATRLLGKAGRPISAEAGIELVKKLAPTVIGNDVVVGMPCVVRRQDLSAGAWIERCIFEDPDKQWPPEMRFQTLAETGYYVDKGVTKTGNKSRTVKVIRNALIDTGVFNMPRGVSVREMK